MNYETDIPFVDTHAEGNGGTHDSDGTAHPLCLHLHTVFGLEPSMVGTRTQPELTEPAGKLVAGGLGVAVDDARAGGRLPRDEASQIGKEISV
jgi:hypothetical protein